MKSHPALSLLLALPLMLSAARAEVVVLRRPAAPHSPWLPNLEHGSLSIGLLPGGAADAVGELIDGRDLIYFGQSIKGNGRILSAVAFYGNGSDASSAVYSITLLDYGITGPIDTAGAFTPPIPPVVVFNESFTLTNSPAAQLYFEFQGDARVRLDREHSYVFLIASAGGGGGSFYRLNGRDSVYADGTAAKGLTALNPDAFAGPRALRDAIFALYTSAD